MKLVITGLYRDKKSFLRMIESYKPLVNSGVIQDMIFSTWKERVTEEDMSSLEKSGIKLILGDEPKDIGPGSIRAQQKAISNALSVLEDEDFVFKTRTDVHVSASMIEHVSRLEDSETLLTREGVCAALSRKMWINAFEITKPFYIEDAIYASKVCDMRLLNIRDDSFDQLYGKDLMGGETHLRQFIAPFMKLFPLFAAFKERLQAGGFISPIEKDIRLLLETDSEYRRMLATYYSCLVSNFHVENLPGEIRHKHSYCDKGRSRFSYDSFYYNFVNQRAQDGTLQRWCHDSKWLDDMHTGRFNSEPAAEEISDMMRELL